MRWADCKSEPANAAFVAAVGSSRHSQSSSCSESARRAFRSVDGCTDSSDCRSKTRNRIQLNSCSLASRIWRQVGQDAQPKARRPAFFRAASIALLDSKLGLWFLNIIKYTLKLLFNSCG